MHSLVQKLFGYIFFATTYSAKTYGFNREFFFLYGYAINFIKCGRKTIFAIIT